MGGDGGRLHRPAESTAGHEQAQEDPKHVGNSVDADRAWAQNRIANYFRGQRVMRKPDADVHAAEESKVSQPGDPAEKEADTVADHVVDHLHGGGAKPSDEKPGAAKAPAIGAKLDGARASVMRSKDDKQAPKQQAGLGYYRGGSSVEPKSGEYKVKAGMVQPTHGVSLYNNSARVAKWGAFVVMSIPPTLKIIQRGADPEHFEIVPVKPMPEAEYKAALAGVVLQKHEDK